jgi:hypothetical protein
MRKIKAGVLPSLLYVLFMVVKKLLFKGVVYCAGICIEVYVKYRGAVII